ncbi:Glutathione s-transferase protein [Paraburkholderia tropica]
MAPPPGRLPKQTYETDLRNALREFGSLADVRRGRHVQQTLLRVFGNCETRDEGLQRFARDALAAREFLQLLVRVFDAVAAHHGLHRLGQHFPRGVEVVVQTLRVHFELVDTADQRVVGEQRVTERDADIAQHRRVGQVALPARHGQLVGEVTQRGVRETEVAFRVFEVDRIDLVRHRRRTDFAGLQLLLEVAERDVAPHVAVEVEQDRVRARDGVEQFGHVVVRLDLDRVRVEREFQALFDDVLRERFPVEFRIRREVRVEVADRAVHLAEQFDLLDARDCARETGGDVGDFLAERRRARGLTVRAREHRLVGLCVRERHEALMHRAQRRQDHVLTRAGEHQAVRRVVDVFRGAGEVDELAGALQFRLTLHRFLEPVLDRLHVVVRHALDVLDARGVVRREVLGELEQELLRRFREARHFRETGLRQRDQPVDFHGHAIAHEGGFREPVAQGFGFRGVAAVERGERVEREEGIGTSVGHDGDVTCGVTIRKEPGGAGYFITTLTASGRGFGAACRRGRLVA